MRVGRNQRVARRVDPPLIACQQLAGGINGTSGFGRSRASCRPPDFDEMPRAHHLGDLGVRVVQRRSEQIARHARQHRAERRIRLLALRPQQPCGDRVTSAERNAMAAHQVIRQLGKGRAPLRRTRLETRVKIGYNF